MQPIHALLIALGSAAFASAATAALFSALQRRPLRALLVAATAIAEGRTDARSTIDGDENDGEIAQLGGALNRIAGHVVHATDQLRADRDRLASILDGMGEGVLVVDAQDRIVLANRAIRAMAMIGDHAIGQLVLEAIRNATLQEALDAARAQDEPIAREIELGRLLPRKLLVRVSRLRSPNGEASPTMGAPPPNGARRRDERDTIAVFHDVTDLRRLETIRTDFVANVSHELRTPVTAIATATETLLGGALSDPDDAAEFVGVIDRHAHRLRQLVDDLLDLAKLESKGYRLALAEVDVGPLLRHVAELMEEAAKRRRSSLRVESQAGTSLPSIRVKADRKALEQVLLNLADNAVKYAGDGATVTLSAAVNGEAIELAVADDGVGIPPHHLGRIFERFYRVDAGRSRELGGTGLGLAIVKHLVELMGGTIGVDSAPGKGARFTIRLHAATGTIGAVPPDLDAPDAR